MTAHSEPLLNRHRYSRAQYHAMGAVGMFAHGERVELIEGEIIDMAPIGTTHYGTVNWLNAVLAHAVHGRAIVSVQNPLVLDDFSEPEPDLAVLRHRADFYRTHEPTPADVLLRIEVGASRQRYDREVKLPLYARHGVAEVWLFDLNASAAIRYCDLRDGQYIDRRRIDGPARVVIPGLEGVAIDLSDPWH